MSVAYAINYNCDPPQFIVGGEDTKAGEFPWAALVRLADNVYDFIHHTIKLIISAIPLD